MSGWSPVDYSAATTPVIASAVTNQVISKENFPIYAGGSKNIVVRIKASGVTVVGTITAKLQSAIGDEWQDSKTVTISANGYFYIKLNVQDSSDWTYLPLLSKGRVVITTTNANDRVTIDSIYILQEL